MVVSFVFDIVRPHDPSCKHDTCFADHMCWTVAWTLDTWRFHTKQLLPMTPIELFATQSTFFLSAPIIDFACLIVCA